MSQSDFQIDNVSRSLFRTENNQALQALASLSSGATEPATPYAYMWWADTSANILKMRNAANTAWINKGSLSATDSGYIPAAGGTFTGDVTMTAAAIIEAEGAAVAAAAGAIDIWATDGNTRHITGNTGPITSFGTAPQAGMWMKLIFDGTPILTNSANLNLNSTADVTIEAGDVAFVYADTTTQAYVFIIRKSGQSVGASSARQIQDIDASVAANSLTVSINPTTLDFRSTTLTDGTPVSRVLSSLISLVVPNTATLGTVNAVASRLAILAIDNAGTIEPAIVNLSGGNNLDETTLISTTALSAAADSANVIYSTTARTNVAFRVVGFIDITESTAGVWATGPSLVQSAGGQALAALSSLGYGQTWQNLTGSRSIGTTYYNTTGKPIDVSIESLHNAGATAISLTVAGVIAAASFDDGGRRQNLTATVPPGASYVLTQVSGTAAVNRWSELR
jgi:hypothetical protein